MGANLSMTRTPDVHFISEARHEGAKFVVISPDFSQVAKYADWWLPVEAGQDTALWLAVNHVILEEFHAKRQVPYFIDYLKRYDRQPVARRARRDAGGLDAPASSCAPTRSTATRTVENGDWKLLDVGRRQRTRRGCRRARSASAGRRRTREGQVEPASWRTGSTTRRSTRCSPSSARAGAEVAQVAFHEFADRRDAAPRRAGAVRRAPPTGARSPVATVYDLLFAQFGVGRGLAGDYPTSYDDVGAVHARPGRSSTRRSGATR